QRLALDSGGRLEGLNSGLPTAFWAPDGGVYHGSGTDQGVGWDGGHLYLAGENATTGTATLVGYDPLTNRSSDVSRPLDGIAASIRAAVYANDTAYLGGEVGGDFATATAFLASVNLTTGALTNLSGALPQGWHEVQSISGPLSGGGILVTGGLPGALQVGILTGSAQVTFNEAGLPPGTEWFVNVTGIRSLNSSTPAISTVLLDGAYRYTLASSNPTYGAAAGGTLDLRGSAPVWVNLTFSPKVYSVSYTETGLNPRSLERHGWSVALNGSLEHSTSPTITFPAVRPGTYPVLVTGPAGWRASGSGTVTVSGPTAVPVAIEKGRVLTLSFHEKGLRGVPWCASVDGYETCTAQKALKFADLAPGTYTYAIFPVANDTPTVKLGKVSEPTTGSLELARSTALKLDFGTNTRISLRSNFGSGTELLAGRP
ncbi:MAG TPA: hypothetical protein VMH49_05820, partial [Thermoplasmata archaeon]|nr:hypothetical protein [Thermoplasmata archaeon]